MEETIISAVQLYPEILYKKKNYKNLRIINRNKLFYLSEKARILNEKEKYLNIKLIVLNNSKLNLRFLFNNCNSLIKLIDISKKKKYSN